MSDDKMDLEALASGRAEPDFEQIGGKPKRGGRRPAAPRTNAERPRGEARKRVPFGAPRTKLEVDVEALRESGYHVHWFNDENGRVEEAEAAFYEFVKWGELGVRRGREAHEGDERVSKRVGTLDNGEPLMAFLMKVPMEYYLQDEQSKLEQNARKVEDMQRGVTDEISRDKGGFYQDDHQRIKTRTEMR